MSAIIDATYEGETFEVEIFHDGHIEFPGRNLQHEQAMAEFTDSESAVLRFYNLWKESPTKVIFENLELPENSIPRLAADYAEHILYLYENKYRGDLRPRNAINAARKFVAGEIDRPTLEKAAWVAEAAAGRKAAGAAAAWVAEAAADSAAAAAAWAAARVAVDAADAVEAAWAAGAAARAAWAAAYNVSSEADSPEWQQARDVEVAWQIRRFVDVMEAIGQGFDWPDMKVTP